MMDRGWGEEVDCLLEGVEGGMEGMEEELGREQHNFSCGEGYNFSVEKFGFSRREIWLFLCGYSNVS